MESIKINITKSNHVTFSPNVHKKSKDHTILLRNRVVKVASLIRTQFQNEDKLTLVLKPNGNFRVFINSKKHKLDQLNPKVQHEIQALLNSLNGLNINNSPSVKNDAFSFNRLITGLKAFIQFYVFVRPRTNALIASAINQAKSRDELLELYTNPGKLSEKDLFQVVKEDLRNKSPFLFSYYSSSDLDRFISAIIVERINKKLSQLKQPHISEAEFFTLNIQKVLSRIAENPSSNAAYIELMASNPLNIPLKELAAVPFTPEQKDNMTRVWEGVLNNLFTIGMLDSLCDKSDTRGLLIQMQYARQYLEALSLMPDSFKNGLTIVSSLEEMQPKANLKSFLIQHASPFFKNMKFEDMQKTQKLYREKALFPIHSFLDKKIDHSTDAASLISLLSSRKNKDIDSLIESIHHNLSEKDKELLSQDILTNLFFNELEIRAASEYHLLTPQIVNLRKVRGSHDFSLEEALFSDEVLSSISKKTLRKSPFTVDEHIDLMRLTKFLSLIDTAAKSNEPVRFTEKEKQQFQDILSRLEKNSKLKKTLPHYLDSEAIPFLNSLPPFLRGLFKLFIPSNRLPAGISTTSVKFAMTYLSKIKSVEKEPPILKAKALLENSASDRLTLKEVGQISSYSRLRRGRNNFISYLEAFNLAESDPKIQKLQEYSIKSAKIMEQIETLIEPAINEHYKSGDLLAYQAGKKTAWTGRGVSFEEKVTAFVTGSFTHGAKLYSREGQVHISHVDDQYIDEKVSLYQICISDVWELDISKLVNPSFKPALKELYGKDWKKKINAQYQEIERKLHSEQADRFKGIQNSKFRRIKAGLANFKGRHRNQPRDFKGLHEKFFNGTPITGDQICSEFASKATLVSMIELNDQLKKARADVLGDIIELPYSNKERLQTIHPGRMIEILENKKCLRKKELPEAIKSLIEI